MAVTIASHDVKVGESAQRLFDKMRFRWYEPLFCERIALSYYSNDVIGVEVGGALKNPLAIGAVNLK